MSKKRISGGKRRTLARIKRQFNELGIPVPPSKSGRTPPEELLWNLRKDLAWIGKPGATDSDVILSHDRVRSYYLRNFDYDTTYIAPDLQLIWQLQNDPQFDNAYYKGIKERTLRRHVAIVQREIWGPKK